MLTGVIVRGGCMPLPPGAEPDPIFITIGLLTGPAV
jgi:hypothetical protein